MHKLHKTMKTAGNRPVNTIAKLINFISLESTYSNIILRCVSVQLAAFMISLSRFKNYIVLLLNVARMITFSKTSRRNHKFKVRHCHHTAPSRQKRLVTALRQAARLSDHHALVFNVADRKKLDSMGATILDGDAT